MRFLALSALLCAAPASASDGVIEINQTNAEGGGVTPLDAPGFPVTLSKSASYLLTSNLDVPAGTNGITIPVPDVTLDLNGFRIESTYTCCAGSGTGHGIEATANRVTVIDGHVSGFADRGVLLQTFSHVERVSVRQVGSHGIQLGNGGLALANRVQQAGGSGIRFVGTIAGLYRDNVLADVAQAASSTARAIDGLAHASGGNVCEDFSCSRRGARRYYLTKTDAFGDEAANACDSGFHFASLHEIREISHLEWDSLRGRATAADSSVGGPQTGLIFSWIRTGYSPDTAQAAGEGNCDGWSTRSSTASGTLLALDSNWGVDPGAWIPAVTFCSSARAVWCVED